MIIIVTIVLLLLSYCLVFSRKTQNSVLTTSGRGAEKTQNEIIESNDDTLLRKRLCLPFRNGSITLALCDKLSAEQLSSLSNTIHCLEKVARVYLLMLCEEEDRQSTLLQEISSRLPGFRHVHRILFYSTSVGKIALVRQLKPSLHVEHDSIICAKLAPHITKIVLIDVDDGGALDSVIINSGQSRGCVQRVATIESLLTVAFANQLS